MAGNSRAKPTAEGKQKNGDKPAKRKRSEPKAPPVSENESDSSNASTSKEFFIETILSACSNEDHDWDYKVRWYGYGSDEDTWESHDNLARNCEELLQNFWDHWGGDPDYGVGEVITPSPEWVAEQQRRSRKKYEKEIRSNSSKNKGSLASFRMQKLPHPKRQATTPTKEAHASTSRRSPSPLPRRLIHEYHQLDFSAPGEKNILPFPGSKRPSKMRDAQPGMRVKPGRAPRIRSALHSDEEEDTEGPPTKRPRITNKRRAQSATKVQVSQSLPIDQESSSEHELAQKIQQRSSSPASLDSLFSGPTPSPTPTPDPDEQPSVLDAQIGGSLEPMTFATDEGFLNEPHPTPSSSVSTASKQDKPVKIVPKPPPDFGSRTSVSVLRSQPSRLSGHEGLSLSLPQSKTAAEASGSPTSPLSANPTKARLSKWALEMKPLGRQTKSKQRPVLSSRPSNTDRQTHLPSGSQAPQPPILAPQIPTPIQDSLQLAEAERFLDALDLDPNEQLGQATGMVEQGGEGLRMGGTVLDREREVLRSVEQTNNQPGTTTHTNPDGHKPFTFFIGKDPELKVAISDYTPPISTQCTDLSVILRLQQTFKFPHCTDAHFLAPLILQSYTVVQFARVSVEQEYQSERFDITARWLGKHSLISRAKFDIGGAVPGSPGSLILFSPATARAVKQLGVPPTTLRSGLGSYLLVAFIIPRIKPSLQVTVKESTSDSSEVNASKLKNLLGDCSGRGYSMVNNKRRDTVHSFILKKALHCFGLSSEDLYRGHPHFLFIQQGTIPEKIPGLAHRRFNYPSLHFITFGHGPFCKEGSYQEIWPLGGLVTFTPRVLLEMPFQLQSKLRSISRQPFYDVYLPPACLGYICRRFKLSGRPIESKIRILLQQLLLDMVREGTIILTECPPQRWEGGTVHQWRDRSRKLDDLCSLTALCSLKEMTLSGSGDRIPSLDGPTKALVDHCSERATELELEGEEDVDEYILHDIGRLQMSQMGMNNYRRFVVLVSEGKDKPLTDCRNGIEVQVPTRFEFYRHELSHRPT